MRPLVGLKFWLTQLWLETLRSIIPHSKSRKCLSTIPIFNAYYKDALSQNWHFATSATKSHDSRVTLWLRCQYKFQWSHWLNTIVYLFNAARWCFFVSRSTRRIVGLQLPFIHFICSSHTHITCSHMHRYVNEEECAETTQVDIKQTKQTCPTCLQSIVYYHDCQKHYPGLHNAWIILCI